MGGTSDDQANPHILRSARNSFLDHILKRPNFKPQSIRYDDTSAEPLEPEPIISPNTKMRGFGRRTSNGGPEPSNRTPLIISFYDPAVKAIDFQGRKLENILRWNDHVLERSHNYIQILFPLPEGSPFNYEAPIITREVFDAFRSRAELRNELRKSLIRMLDFYGFEMVDEFSMQKKPEPEVEVENKHEAEVDEPAISTEAKTADADIVDPASEEKQTEGVAPVTSENRQPEVSTAGMTEVTSSSAGPSKQTRETDATPEVAADSQPTGETVKVEENVGTTKAKEKSEDGEKTAGAFKQEEDNATKPPAPQPTEKLPSLSGGIVIVRSEEWQRAFRNWAVRFDHNHLRITRILRCLRVLGLEEEAEAFYSALKEVFDDPAIHINERSMLYWRKAVRAPLHVAPDGERIPWLKRWADEQEEAQQNVGDARA